MNDSHTYCTNTSQESIKITKSTQFNENNQLYLSNGIVKNIDQLFHFKIYLLAWYIYFF